MDTQEKNFYTAILIASGILLVILIYFVVSLVRHRRKNLQLHYEKINAEISTLEKERKRLAADLHDDLGPILSAIKIRISMLDDLPPQDQEQIDIANSYLDSMLVRVREISNNLLPQTLVRKGLIIALQELIIQTRKVMPQLDIQLKESEKMPLSKDAEIHLYRITQEVINNAIKHAQASFIKIEMETKDYPKFVFSIADNGKGFNAKDTDKYSKGLGLKNIVSRVDMLQGNLYLDTAEGKGTTYNIEFYV